MLTHTWQHKISSNGPAPLVWIKTDFDMGCLYLRYLSPTSQRLHHFGHLSFWTCDLPHAPTSYSTFLCVFTDPQPCICYSGWQMFLKNAQGSFLICTNTIC